MVPWDPGRSWARLDQEYLGFRLLFYLFWFPEVTHPFLRRTCKGQGIVPGTCEGNYLSYFFPQLNCLIVLPSTLGARRWYKSSASWQPGVCNFSQLDLKVKGPIPVLFFVTITKAGKEVWTGSCVQTHSQLCGFLTSRYVTRNEFMSIFPNFQGGFLE